MVRRIARRPSASHPVYETPCFIQSGHRGMRMKPKTRATAGRRVGGWVGGLTRHHQTDVKLGLGLGATQGHGVIPAPRPTRYMRGFAISYVQMYGTWP